MSTLKEVGETRGGAKPFSIERSVATGIAGLGALIGGGGVIVGVMAPYVLAAILIVPSLMFLRRSQPADGRSRSAAGMVSYLVFMALIGWWLSPSHSAAGFCILYGAFLVSGGALMSELRARVAVSVGARAGAVVVAAIGALIAGGGMLQGSVDWWAPYLLASLLLVPSLVVLYWIRPASGARRYAIALVVCLGFMGLVGWLSDPLRPAASSYILFWPAVCIGAVLAWRSLLSALSG